MLLAAERRNAIVARVNATGSASVRDLAALYKVTEATIRRDLESLEQAGHLERSHGGALSRSLAVLSPPPNRTDGPLLGLDGLILAPVQASVLRERLQRQGVPVVAESAPQPGLPFVGPNDHAAGLELGRWTGAELRKRRGRVTVLCITYQRLENTRQRSQGFVEGLREGLGEDLEIHYADGQGLYTEAYEGARDAMRSYPDINVIFGVNDDSVLGAIQAHRDLGHDPQGLLAVSIGVEGNTLLEMLAQGGPLKASVALFPEVVGVRLLDTVVAAMAGQPIQPTQPTPHAILTAHNLGEHYAPQGTHWKPVASLSAKPPHNLIKPVQGKRIGFVIQYLTHEWYQNLARYMRLRAQEYGLEVEVLDVRENLRSEVRELRRMIGKHAAQLVGEGERVLLDAGGPTLALAQFLHGKRGLQVMTNSLEVFDELRSDPAIALRLTGGELDRNARALVGVGARAGLQHLRADKVFLSAAGLCESFGVSSLDEREAEVRSAMAGAAREVVVLADHTVIGYEANHHVVPLTKINTLVTDPGIEPKQALALRNLGIKVVIAGEMSR